MRINKVEISNFYSFTDQTFIFDKYKGIVLIKGENLDSGGSNGSGKSALIESVVWGLFGKTIRKSTEEALVNNAVGSGCTVRIFVDDQFVIERSKRPSSLRFYKGSEELTQAHATQTQNLIEETLGTTYKVFLASTVFGQQNQIEFLSATPDDKRLIMRNFLGLDEMFALRESVKYLKSEYSQRSKACDTIIQENESSWKKLDKQREKIYKDVEEIENSPYADALKYDLDEIMAMEKSNADLEYEIAHKRKEVESLDRATAKAERELAKPKKSKCRTCGSELTVKDNSAILSKEIKANNRAKKKLEKEASDLLEGIQDIPISSLQYNRIARQREGLSGVNTLNELIEGHIQRIDEVTIEKQDLNRRYEIMRFWEKAFSEAGLVKYIIQNILGYFNQQVSFYLSHLTQGKFTVEFDDSLNETIKHGQNVTQYISLSGGEKRKISLAVLLALQDLLKVSQKEETNIMFFDEVAENLDEEGVLGLYQLLLELKSDKTIFVVTHNKVLIDMLVDNPEILVSKKDGISTILN